MIFHNIQSFYIRTFEGKVYIILKPVVLTAKELYNTIDLWCKGAKP
ncbi:hypothetical protein C1A50_0736 [Paenibacillus polymyxa]|nr:hypothetical protein C1A50_0736 [Paenibacillus polymyxa]